MQQKVSPHHHLLTIAFSHYNEKARWAFAYYGVPYTQHLLLPAFHIPTIKSIPDQPGPGAKPASGKSPFSTPYLVVYKPMSSEVNSTYHDSHDILIYLSDNFSTVDRVNLYTSCGSAQTGHVLALEKRYDEVLGKAARSYAYYNMLALNRWRSMIPFALIGFQNGVGALQSALWLLMSPLLAPMLVQRSGASETSYREAIDICRHEFKLASEMLESSPYLAGDRLSAADITFAALSYPVLGISHTEGFQEHPPPSSVFTLEGQAFVNELRATKAGQHALRLFKEERVFGSPLPSRKKTLFGLW